MHCPRCLTSPPATSVYRQPQHRQETRPSLAEEQHPSGSPPAQTTIDRCPSCGGAFLDAGELEKLESAARRRRARWQATSIPGLVQRAYAQARRPNDGAIAEEKQPLDCPRCDGVMFEREWSIGTMVRVDVCIDCRGVWLDGGELDTLVELFGGSSA